MLPIIATIASAFASKGLNLLSSAALSKGKDWLEEKTGVDLTEPNKLSDEDLLTLKKYQFDHEEELRKIKLEFDKLAYIDTADARDMTVKLSTSEGSSWLARNTTYVQSYVIIGLTFFMYYHLIFVGFDPSVKDVALIITGTLTGLITQVASFFYGTSKSSADKNDSIKKMIGKNK